MKNLIYFVSFGELSNKILLLALKSLFKIIDHKDYEIVVMSDKFCHEKVKTIIITSGNRFCDKALQRTYLHHHLDISVYDFIYYFDTDFIFHNPISHLLSDDNRIILCRAVETKMNSSFINLTEVEKKLAGQQLAINSGCFIVPNKLSKLFYEKWELYVDKHLSESGTIQGQSALNKMVVNNILPFDYFNTEHIYFPANKLSIKTDKTIATHYAGHSDEQRIVLMNHF